MIRAYDDNGNVVDLVKWENRIYNKALDDVFKGLLDKTTPTGKYIDSAIVLKVLEQLMRGKEND